MYKGQVFEYLDDDEQLELVLKGKFAEIIQGEETKSQYGGKGVYTAIWVQRIILIIGQRLLGTDVRNIRYDSIDGIDIEKSALLHYINIHSGGRTYKMNVFDKERAEIGVTTIRERVDGLKGDDKQKDSADSSLDNNGANSENPTDRIQNLKELREEGLISEKEFEEKKESIIEEI